MTEMADTLEWDSNNADNTQDSYVNIDQGSEQVTYYITYNKKYVRQTEENIEVNEPAHGSNDLLGRSG